MIKNKDYYYENQKIQEILKNIINKDDSNRRKHIAASILSGCIILATGVIIYFMRDMEPGKTLDIISIVLGFMGMGVFVGFIIIILKEDNRKYRYYNIQEERLKEGLKARTVSKIAYHNHINDIFDNHLISEGVLIGYNIEKDIRILDFHINLSRNEIAEKEVKPLFLRGSVAFFILFITVAIQIITVFYHSYEKLDSILLAVSILIMICSIFTYSIFYMFSSFYKDFNNRKLYSLKLMICHLEIIKLKRLNTEDLEIENTTEKKSKLRRIVDILLN